MVHCANWNAGKCLGAMMYRRNDKLRMTIDKKKANKEHKDNNFYTRERFYGDFQRSINLPSDADTDKVETSFKDGVLQIMVSKSTDSHVKSIEIKG